MYIHRLLREKKVMSLVHYKMDSFSQKHFSNFINKLLKSFHLEKYPRHFSKSETNVSELLCPCYPSANYILSFIKDMFNVLPACNYNLYHLD